MPLPEPGDEVSWMGLHYYVVAVVTEPSVVLEYSPGGQRATVAVSRLDLD